MSFCTIYQTPDTLLDDKSASASMSGQGQSTIGCVPYCVDAFWELPANNDLFFNAGTLATPLYSEMPAGWNQPTTTTTTTTTTASPELRSCPPATPTPSLLSNSTSSIPSTDEHTDLVTSYNTSKFSVDPTSLKPKDVIKTRPRGRPRKKITQPEDEMRLSTTAESPLDDYRAKNRKASAKCRDKERARAATLEKVFQDQQKRNTALKQTEMSLRDELYFLRMQALRHDGCDCTEVQTYNRQRAQKVAEVWNLSQPG